MNDDSRQTTSTDDILRLSVEIATAYVSHNPVAAPQLRDVINTVFESLRAVEGDGAPAGPPKPAVSIRKSITPDYLVCLEDGRKLKMLKRHLRTTYDMTPEEYRAKWNLPADYPMVAPNYAKQRSEFAKKIGLGKPGGKATGKRKRR